MSLQSTEAATPATHYRTVQVDCFDIFYREAGPKDAPTILLLHGFPTLSHMYRHLIPLLRTTITLSRLTIPASATAPLQV